MTEKILVTGCGGYVGSTLVRTLLNEGYQVKGMDSFYKGSCDNLIELCGNPSFEFMEGDVLDEKAVKKAVKDADVVIHLAALVGEPVCRKNPVLAKLVNEDGTYNVARFLSKNQRLLFASTGSVYGVVEGICTEDSELNSTTEYGITKARAEEYALCNENSLVFRFATAFGVSPKFRLPLLTHDLPYRAIVDKYFALYQSGARRTFIHVKDMARAFVWAIQERPHRLYNCGDNSLNWTKKQLADFIQERTGCLVYLEDYAKDADNRDYEVDYSRLNNDGFYCLTGMAEGLEEVLKVIPLLKIRHNYE